MAEYIEGAEIHEVPLGDMDFMEEDEREEDDAQGVVTRLMEQAVNFYEENVEPDQVKATDYFYGRPFGNEKKGRSRVVSTDVRDATLTQIPAIMDILYSPEKTVEFIGRGLEDEPVAAQQTDWVNYLVTEQEESFESIHAIVEDTLVRRIGIAKWWYEEAPVITGAIHTGITEQEYVALASEENVEVEVDAVYPSLDDPNVMLYDCHIERTADEGRPMWAAVPNEEFFFTPGARSIGDAQVIAHSRMVGVGYLVALGHDEEELEEYLGKRKARGSEGLDWSRQFTASYGVDTDQDDDNRDESEREILYTEAYVHFDGNDDGTSELRKFECIGPEYHIVGPEDGELVGEVPFAVFRGIPLAHNLMGLGNWDLLGDIQLINSQIQRGTLDSLAVSINPVTEIVQGEVNMQDAMNTDAVKFVRVRRPGMMREVRHSFVGSDTLPLLGYFGEIKENRTGTSKAAMGLDADSLQSTTKAGVAATMSGSQQRLKFIARSLCETGMRRLYKGLLGLTVRHPQPGRIFRLRGKYVEIDPRDWDTSMDVRVNIGLGQGTPEDKVAAIGAVLGKLEEYLASGAPFVSFVEIRRAAAKALDLAGFRSDDFLKPWGEREERARQQQAAQQPPPPDPATMLVEVEKMKLQLQQMRDQADMELDRWKATMEDDRERDKIARESALKELELELKYKAMVDKAALDAQVARDRAAMDAE